MNDRCRVRTIRWRLLAACWLLAPAVVLAADPAKQTPPAKKTAGSAGAMPLSGSWDVQALFIRAPGDANVDAPNGWSQGRRYSVTFTDKTLTLRFGTEVIAEMTYTWNSTSDPCTIDVKWPAGAMLGILARRGKTGDRLQMNLNDAADGRPRDFSKEHSNVVLVLSRAGPAKASGAAKGMIRVHVLGPDGEPMAGAKIHVGVWTKEPFKHNRDFATDAQGQAAVKLPQRLEILRLWARADKCVPLFAHWEKDWPEGGFPIPAEFTFQLESGTTIGGVVNSDDGRPIRGVKVEAMYQRDRAEGQPANQPIIGTWLASGDDARTTDAKGRWTMDNIPLGRSGEVMLRFRHPDYTSDHQWGGLQRQQDIAFSDLRRQTATVLMSRGISVTGTVTNPQGKPVAGAVVAWGNNPYLEASSSGRRQEVLTDAGGIYRLPPLPTGPMTVTVMAQGWAPDLKKLTIAADNRKVDFPLKKGKTLRLRFVDRDGKPVSGVGVLIEGWRGAKSLYNHKLAYYVVDTKIPNVADTSGIYEWTWAPDDSVDYSFGKAGYEGVGAAIAADGTEQEIRLSPP